MAEKDVDIYFDERNTARPTRGRFHYQDESVALRCVANLVSGVVAAVMVEWSTDYLAVLAGGGTELVSVKHRDPGQGDWTMSLLAPVLRDLHMVWRQMPGDCRCAFASNAGVTTSAASEVRNNLERYVDAPPEEVARFGRVLGLPDPPLPRRTEITAVGVRDMAGALSLLGRDVRYAEECYRALVRRVESVAVEKPHSPEQRIARLTGSVRTVNERKRLRQSDQTLWMTDLRDLVLATEAACVRRTPPPIRAAVPSVSAVRPREVRVGAGRYHATGPAEELVARDGSYRLVRADARPVREQKHDFRLTRLEIVRPGQSAELKKREIVAEIRLHATVGGLPPVVDQDDSAFVTRLPPGSALSKVYGTPPYPAVVMDAMLRSLPAFAHTLAGLHALGKAHRALRPDAFLASRDRLWLRDAGLAATEAEAGEGPAGYRAPEQERPIFQPPGPATDVYQLAAVLYHLTTGRLPTRNPPPPTLLRPDLAAGWDSPLLAGLSTEPARRPGLKAFLDELGAARC